MSCSVFVSLNVLCNPMTITQKTLLHMQIWIPKENYLVTLTWLSISSIVV